MKIQFHNNKEADNSMHLSRSTIMTEANLGSDTKNQRKHLEESDFPKRTSSPKHKDTSDFDLIFTCQKCLHKIC